MKVKSVLKKEGITIVKQLDTLQVNVIAKSISDRLCLTFPEHNINQSDVFSAICRLNMYVADMGIDLAGAKYFSKNNSIYFNKDVDFGKLSDVAIHECIHVVQEIKDENDNLVCMGLYDTSSGLGINEATVQLMTAEVNSLKMVQEKYFDISLNTVSPDYYPLECALVKQLAYFTGTYPLYHSTLYSNDVFKNTLIAKSDKKTYHTIIKNLDKLLDTENELHYFIHELQDAEIQNTREMINRLIVKRKSTIISLFFKTQNLIIKKLFSNEFNSIRNLQDVKDFKVKFYKFKNLIGSSDAYTFYNDSYINMMDLLEQKREYIETYGEINLFANAENHLMIIDEAQNIFSLLMTLFKKTKKLFNKAPKIIDINEWD